MITKEDLDDFAKSPDLSHLEELLNEPNIFNILKLETNELAHSNFLAWLLDPKGSHKLGDLFLKEFLKKVIPNLGNFEQLSFSDARIEREKNNIDILITDDSNNLLVVIENKIYSQETGDQLNRYEAHAQKEY